MVQTCLWFDRPVVDGDRGDTAQREQGHLFHGLIVRSEVPAGQYVTVNERLQRVHSIKDAHGFAVVEDGQVRDKVLLELVQQARHRPVCEH